MKNAKLIGKIFGIGLVLVMIAGMLSSMPALRGEAEASPAITGGYTVATGAEPGSTGLCSQRKLTVTSDGNLHVIYHRKDGSGILQIYHAESSDGGATWTEEQVTSASRDQNFPALAVDSTDNLHLVWEDGRLGQPGIVPNTYYQKKTTSWQAAELVASYATVPSIAIDGNDSVHVVYGTYVYTPGYYGGGNGIRWREKTSAGWQTEESISSNKYWVSCPAIAIDGNNNIHVAWTHAPRYKYYDIHYRVRTFTGWGSEVEVNAETNNELGGHPSITIDSNNHAHIVWQHGSGSDYMIKYREYTTSLQPTVDLEGPTTYIQYSPVIAVDRNDNIHVLWSGQHSGSPSSLQIRYRKYTTTWQLIENLTSSSSNNQTNPSSMWAFYPVVGGTSTNQQEDGYAFVWMDGTTVKYWAAVSPPPHAPITHASDINGQPDPMYPATEYTVTAKYFDPDGREDLKYCYLQLKHPDKPLTMMWNEATDDFWVYAGEEGEDYLTASGDSASITEGGLEGYELAWKFTINDQWPEVENVIDFGVYAWDYSDLISGWDYDDSNAWFSLTKPDHILTEHLRSLVAGSLYRIEELGDMIVGTDGLVEISNYFEQAVSRRAVEAFLSLCGEAMNKVYIAAYDTVLIGLPVLEKMMVLELKREGKSEDITRTIEGHIAKANLEINAKLQDILDDGHSIAPELVEAYIRDIELRRAAHSSLELIAYAQREALTDAAETLKARESIDMTLRALWSIGKTLVGYFYPPAWPLLLTDTVLSTLMAAEELDERGTLWASSLLAASSAQTSMWEIWSNTLDGLELITDGEPPVIPECELEWLSDHLIDHDAAMRGHLSVPGGFGVEAYSLLRLSNTGQHDAEYKVVARFVGAPWSDKYTISMSRTIKAGDEALIRLDYTECERFQVYLEGGIPPIQTLTRYRGTPPEDLNIVDYYVFARTETGLYGLRSWFRIFSPTTEPGWTATATIRTELAHLGSPAELRVRDSMGRISGIIDGEVKQGIPNAAAFDDNTIFIFDSSAHMYEVKGMDAGTYRLDIVAIQDGESTGIGAIDIPITTGAMHQYVINWDALSQGEPGVTVKIDSNGDNVFEETIVTSQPNTPSNPTPASHTIRMPIDVDLGWVGGDPDAGDTVTYDVCFGTNSNPPVKETTGPYPATQSLIAYDPGTLVDGTTYYWQIAARDNHGIAREGPVWDFTVGQPGPIVTWNLPWGLDVDPASVNIWTYPEDAVAVTLADVEWSMPSGLLIWRYGGPVDGWQFYKKGWGTVNTLETLIPGKGYIGIVPTAGVWGIPQ